MCWGDGEWGRQGGGLRSYIFPAFGFSQMYALCNASTVRFIVVVCVGHAHRTSSNQFRQVPLLLEYFKYVLPYPLRHVFARQFRNSVGKMGVEEDVSL